ncbi:MAG: hypothetical protein V7632_3175 [Bradyrhizobium sp.]
MSCVIASDLHRADRIEREARIAKILADRDRERAAPFGQGPDGAAHRLDRQPHADRGVGRTHLGERRADGRDRKQRVDDDGQLGFHPVAEAARPRPHRIDAQQEVARVAQQRLGCSGVVITMAWAR